MHTILVTGANRGIGLEIVKQYAANGWRVFACSRSTMPIASHENIKVIQLDVSNPNHIDHLVQQIGNEPIDICINNAGIWGPETQSFGAVKADAWLEAFKINSIAPLLIAQVLINNIANGEFKTIVNMTSKMGSIDDNTSGGCYIYRSSKTALNAVTKSMAFDLREKGIKVIALHPGWVQTAMGGPGALITTEQCVNSIKHLLEKLTLEESGSFLNYEGKEIAW